MVLGAAIAADASAEARHLHGRFGAGIILGEPTGITMNIFLSQLTALEFSAAWSLESNNSFQLQGDYVWHMWDLIDVDRGALPVTVGVGGRVVFRDVGDDLLGIRVPLGLAYELDTAPIDFFGQIVPILDLAPSTEFDFDAAVGARFYFGK